MKLDLLPIARQFCRDHDVSNVGLIYQAMLKGAEEALKAATALTHDAGTELERQRSRNLSGGNPK